MKRLKSNVLASVCAKYLELELIGGDVELCSVANAFEPLNGSIKFINRYDKSFSKRVNELPISFVIANQKFKGELTIPHVLSKNPRLDICRLLNYLFESSTQTRIEMSAKIGNNVTLGDGIYIGHNVVIEDDVKIGSGTVVLHNVVISKKSIIGNGCLIKSGCVIGQKGFGFERDETGLPISFPHLGSVIIGNYVEIGAVNTVVAGALSNTVIADYVKTDDHVHIAHNVQIGQKTLITACSEISGSVVIGEQVWLGPNCSVLNGIKINDNSLIGIGSVVRKAVEKGSIVAGNPGKTINRKGKAE